MSFSAWISELNRILIVFGVCTVLGVATGQAPLFLIIGLVVYTLWTAKQVTTLKRWLDKGALLADAPEYLGLADHYVSSIVDLQKQNSDKQNELQDLVDQFNQMITALPDAVVVMTATGKIISSNQAASELLQINPAMDVNVRITQLIRNPSFADFFFAGKFDRPLEIRGAAANEPELSIRIFLFGQDRLVLIAQDMSQLARIYAMRRSFISNASHELRTPLTVVLGYLESLCEHPQLPMECKPAVQSAGSQAQRMKQLVEDLLTLSRIESTAPVAKNQEVVPVASLVIEVAQEAELSTWFTDHDIKTHIETDAMLRGELQEIHSVISNLVNNAIKHTLAGAHIKVIWRLTDEGLAELVVADDGEGIAVEHIDRLTERFYRVDAGRSREKGGTGLGLSIVKHIIERHEGRLLISSEPGQGAVFSCSFPNKRLAFNAEKQ